MRRAQKGDTIIELVMAFAIFSMAAVGTIAILNRGVATTQRNLESTLVRQQVDSQAEMIRYLHDSGNTLWPSLINVANLTSNPAPIGTTGSQCPTPPALSFYVRPTAVDTFSRISIPAPTFTSSPNTYAMIDYSGSLNPRDQGIWLQVAEAENDNGSSVRAYDFYIHGCWMSVGTDVPMTIGTIVRLYDN